MRTAAVAWGMTFFLILGVLICGCKPEVEKFGEPVDDSAAVTAIATVLANPQSYLDKDVVMEGTISSECPAGCNLHLRDSSGATIYVEIHGTSFAPIPQRVGKTARVKGKVYQSEGAEKEIKLFGKGLQIK